jgi:hypothetical protein
MGLMGFHGDMMGLILGFLWILSGSWEMLMGYDGILWNPMVDGTHLKPMIQWSA